MTTVRAALVVHAAGSAFDAYTSWQHLEGNRLLRSPDARFGIRAVALKAGLFGVTALATELVARRSPRAREVLAWVNVGAGGFYGALGVRNLRLR